MSDGLVDHKVERPGCGHMQVIMARPHQSIVDYNTRLVPELKEAIRQPCEQCEKQKADHAKQKLAEEKK